MGGIFINKKTIFASLLALSVIGAVGCAKNEDVQKGTSNSVKQVEKTQSNKSVQKSAQSNANVQTPKQSNNSNQSTTEATQESYQLTSNTYTQNSFTLTYPQITGLSDATKQNAINTIIQTDYKKWINENWILTDTSSGSVKYKVTLQTPNLLSIVYSGYTDTTDAVHPNSIFNTTVIDIKNGKELTLSDIVSLNSAFAEQIRTGKYIVPAGNEGNTDMINGVADYIKSLSDDDLINAIQSTDNFYLTDTSIGVTVPVNHALADFAPIEIELKKAL